jgi:phosphoribosylanthranilate isomerase
MTRVKICGLSEVDHALAALEAGADFVGMVFAESRRKVTAEKARDIVQTLKKFAPRPEAVGVFAGSAVEEVNRIAEFCGLDRVQLSGGESLHYCLGVERPTILSLHISPETSERSLFEAVEEISTSRGRKNLVILLDTKVGSRTGGTGTTFDWKIASKVAGRFEVMIAGGLDPTNVRRLIRDVHPWAVDVSSGVETEGSKDPVKIMEFVESVRSADLRGTSSRAD